MPGKREHQALCIGFLNDLFVFFNESSAKAEIRTILVPGLSFLSFLNKFGPEDQWHPFIQNKKIV